MSLASGLLVSNEVFISPVFFILIGFILFPCREVSVYSERAAKTPNLCSSNPVIQKGTLLFPPFSS